MPTPSKFTQARRRRILEALAAGGSRREAATAAGIDHATLTRWLARGRKGAAGGSWRGFWQDVERAEADPHLLALRADYELWEEEPARAWRFLQRHEQEFTDPPIASEGPLVIHLKFLPIASRSLGRIVAPRKIIERPWPAGLPHPPQVDLPRTAVTQAAS